MQKIDTTSFPAVDPVKSNREFTEVWIDLMLSPPYVLLLLGDCTGNCQMDDPAEGYKAVFSSSIDEEAQLWLLKDEYESIEGRLLASEPS